MESKLLDFIEDNADWEIRLSEPPYSLVITHDGEYTMLKYNQLESDFSIPLVRECRGIIIRKVWGQWMVVCHGFDKFGNYGESYCPSIDWTTASVQEKIDGSLIKIWYDLGEWHISTNGTIDAFKAVVNGEGELTFGDLAMRAMPVSWEAFDRAALKNATYMFELCSKFNRVVVPHDKPTLYFLGWRLFDEEQNPYNSSMVNLFEMPRRYNLHSLDDVRAAAENLPWDDEGYVVCDRFFNRVKIKSPAYVRAHYARNNNIITTERLVEVILAGEQKEFLIYASEWTDELQDVERRMKEFAAAARAHLAQIYEMKDFDSRGRYAAEVSKTPRMMQDFLYHCFTDQIFWDYARKWSAADWAKAIKT